MKTNPSGYAIYSCNQIMQSRTPPSVPLFLSFELVPTPLLHSCGSLSFISYFCPFRSIRWICRYLRPFPSFSSSPVDYRLTLYDNPSLRFFSALRPTATVVNGSTAIYSYLINISRAYLSLQSPFPSFSSSPLALRASSIG